jgi:hypothetical protein
VCFSVILCDNLVRSTITPLGRAMVPMGVACVWLGSRVRCRQAGLVCASRRRAPSLTVRASVWCGRHVRVCVQPGLRGSLGGFSTPRAFTLSPSSTSYRNFVREERHSMADNGQPWHLSLLPQKLSVLVDRSTAKGLVEEKLSSLSWSSSRFSCLIRP